MLINLWAVNKVLHRECLWGVEHVSCVRCAVYLLTGQHEDCVLFAASAWDGRDDQGFNFGATLSHTFAAGWCCTLEGGVISNRYHIPSHCQAAAQQLLRLCSWCKGTGIHHKTKNIPHIWFWILSSWQNAHLNSSSGMTYVLNGWIYYCILFTVNL